jgi:hypothetical protein
MKNLKYLIIFSSIFIFSCNENGSSPSRNKGNNIISTSLPSDPIFDDLIAQYDTVDIVGLVRIMYQNIDTEDEIYENTGGTFDTISTSYEGAYLSARFSNDHFSTFYQIDSLNWENTTFLEYTDNGTYYLLEDDNVINWGDSNYVSLDSNINISGFNQDIYLSSKLKISNIQSGDTINKTSSLQINWNGSSSDYASVQLITNDINHIDNVDIDNKRYQEFTDDDGSYTLLSTDLALLDSGHYSLIITSWEPEFIALSNGDKVYILIQSINKISVTLN